VLKSTERPPEEVACHTKSVAPSPLAHPTKAYLPERVEGLFSEVGISTRNSLKSRSVVSRPWNSLVYRGEIGPLCPISWAPNAFVLGSNRLSRQFLNWTLAICKRRG
jgi:hypothetical protein